MPQIEWTYKSVDTEETIDVLFYRPLGYRIALLSKYVGLSPTAVTIISIIFGVAAGHLFYYPDIYINIWGIVLLIFAETLDSADGQLARITNTKSRSGRILDGFAGNIMFLSIYIHLALRMMNEGTGVWIFVIVLVSGFSHSLQCAIADYYRNAYMYFGLNSDKNEFDEWARMKEIYADMSRKSFFKKSLMWFYVYYTEQQEFFSRNLQNLKGVAEEMFAGMFPEWFSEKYREINKPMLKYYNILTTNTRMIALFVSLLLAKVYLFVIFEIVVLNLMLFAVLFVQERKNAELIHQTVEYREEVPLC